MQYKTAQLQCGQLTCLVSAEAADRFRFNFLGVVRGPDRWPEDRQGGSGSGIGFALLGYVGTTAGVLGRFCNFSSSKLYSASLFDRKWLPVWCFCLRVFLASEQVFDGMLQTQR